MNRHRSNRQEGALLAARGEHGHRPALEGLLDEGGHDEAAVARLARAGHVEGADGGRAQAAVLAVDAHGLGGQLAQGVLDARVEVGGHADVAVLAQDAALAVDLGRGEVDQRDVGGDALVDHLGGRADDRRAQLAGIAQDAGRAHVAGAVDHHVEVVEGADLDQVVLDALGDDLDAARGHQEVLGLDDARHAGVHDGRGVAAGHQALGDERADEPEPTGDQDVAAALVGRLVGHASTSVAIGHPARAERARTCDPSAR